MTDEREPLPPALDGEPDLAAEVARVGDTLKDLAEQTKALKDATDYDGLNASLDGLLSEEGRASIPKEGSKLEQIFARITVALAEAKRPVVPVTDTAKPTLSPVTPDLSALPAHARIARGYRAA